LIFEIEFEVEENTKKGINEIKNKIEKNDKKILNKSKKLFICDTKENMFI